jgi:hypothetical protein
VEVKEGSGFSLSLFSIPESFVHAKCKTIGCFTVWPTHHSQGTCAVYIHILLHSVEIDSGEIKQHRAGEN